MKDSLETIVGKYQYDPGNPGEILGIGAVKEIMNLKTDSQYNSLFYRYSKLLDKGSRVITKKQLITIICSITSPHGKLRRLNYFGFNSIEEAREAVGYEKTKKEPKKVPKTTTTTKIKLRDSWVKRLLRKHRKEDGSINVYAALLDGKRRIPDEKLEKCGYEISLEYAIRYLGEDFKFYKFSVPGKLMGGGKGLLKTIGMGWKLIVPKEVYDILSYYKDNVKGEQIAKIALQYKQYSKMIKEKVGMDK